MSNPHNYPGVLSDSKIAEAGKLLAPERPQDDVDRVVAEAVEKMRRHRRELGELPMGGGKTLRRDGRSAISVRRHVYDHLVAVCRGRGESVSGFCEIAIAEALDSERPPKGTYKRKKGNGDAVWVDRRR